MICSVDTVINIPQRNYLKARRYIWAHSFGISVHGWLASVLASVWNFSIWLAGSCSHMWQGRAIVVERVWQRKNCLPQKPERKKGEKERELDRGGRCKIAVEGLPPVTHFLQPCPSSLIVSQYQWINLLMTSSSLRSNAPDYHQQMGIKPWTCSIQTTIPTCTQVTWAPPAGVGE